jgi:hypothetical protein
LVGVTERTIQTCIQQLAELGLISITHRKGGANLYSFNADHILKPTPKIISALNPMSQRTSELAERVRAAEKRRADIAEKYFRKGEKPTSPGKKLRISPQKETGEISGISRTRVLKQDLRSRTTAPVALTPPPS